MQRVAGIRGEQPRHVFRFGQRRPMRQGAAQIFPQAGTHLPGEGSGCFQPASERLRVVCQPERFQLRRLAVRIFPDEHEVARVRDQHQPIPGPIPTDLLPGHGQESVVVCGFDFDHAAFRRLAFAGLAFLQLLGDVQPEVGMPGALIGQFADAEHFRFEGSADGVQQIRQRAVARPFTGSAARRPDPAQIGEVGLNYGGQARGCVQHGEFRSRSSRPRGNGRRSLPCRCGRPGCASATGGRAAGFRCVPG